MKDKIAEINEIKEISTVLTRENKKYVIAVANALLFSQKTAIKSANEKHEHCENKYR